MRIQANGLRFGAIAEVFLWQGTTAQRKLVTQKNEIDQWVRQFNQAQPDAQVYYLERGAQTGNHCQLGGLVYIDGEDLSKLHIAAANDLLGSGLTPHQLQQALEGARKKNAVRDEYITTSSQSNQTRLDDVA